MKKQWKKMSVLLVMILVFMIFAGCMQNNGDTSPAIEPVQSDLEYVQKKGTLVVGITDYAPMGYHSGEAWIGFDVDLADTFADSIGVTLELEEIDWNKKTELLENGSIDCIWNGMTMTEELQETISCSEPYLSNAQVVVLRSSEVAQYQTVEACQHLLFAVEAGSTGEALLKEMKYRYTTYPTQMEALQSVREKKADAAVIDVIMASSNVGDGQEFEDLDFNISLNDEKICVGFRKDSDLTEKVNEFLEAAYENGRIHSLADKYEIKDAVLQDVSD